MVENRMVGFTEDNDVESITASEVEKHRQHKALNEIITLDEQIDRMEQELAAARREREMLRLEYDIWERYEERAAVRVTHTTTTTVEMGGRMKMDDRMKFEDCLKAVMREAGRPLQFGDIRKRLEKFGFKWNNYPSAHNYITRCGMLEGAGQHGYYQLIRK